MDIDSPQTSTEGVVSSFNAVFPLPFRVLCLVGLGGLFWATNLHFLDKLGVDTAQALRVPHHKLAAAGLPSHSTSLSTSISYAHPSSLWPPIYRIVTSYIAWAYCAWYLFYMLTRGVVDNLDTAKWVPIIAYTVVIVACILPLRNMYGLQRSFVYQSMYRCLFSSKDQEVYFCDVLCADIFTSFAKVLGDIWISLVILLPGGSLRTIPTPGILSDLAAPVLMSLPYAIRLRQCVVEFLGSNGKSRRPLYNAAKYATAFPVIFLSAAQRVVAPESDETPRAWLGEYMLFRLWVIFVLVNSAYSFWWDVTNDWGLSLLVPSNWHNSSYSSNLEGYNVLSQSSTSSARSPNSRDAPWQPKHARRQSSFSALALSSLSSSPRDGIFPTPKPNTSASAIGLRSILLFRDPSSYYLVIFLNFILRFTWSLKLSSHLYGIAEIESSLFMMEALELLRRWIWVFFRVEWEIVKRMSEQNPLDDLTRISLNGNDFIPESVELDALVTHEPLM